MLNGHLQSCDDIMERVRFLDNTLNWQAGKSIELKPGSFAQSMILVSSQTGRILATVIQQSDDSFKTGEDHYAQRFITQGKATEYAKFQVIRTLLSEDLRQHMQ